MSFSMSQIQRKTHSKQDYIKECHFVIKDLDILTDNVKYGLWQYADYRFRKRNRGVFRGDTLKTMIVDLLEYCCNKPFNSISRKDVNNNENQILYEIKKAIFYGATRCLYDANNTVIHIDKSMFKDDVKEPEIIPGNRKLDSEEVKDYFKDLMIC